MERRCASDNPISRSIARLSAAESRGGTRKPLTASDTTSSLPPAIVVTMGRPAAAASRSTIGMPSQNDDIT